MNIEKIDFVLTWVDGSDPEWLAQKSKYMAIDKNMAQGDANANCRYRDHGLLRYWFRAVECFTPWVNKVFFITCGQKPDWLNEANPKLRLVNHQDYIPAEYLPTFQSNTIELNLHHLADLSEHFVLFNDDMFLLRPVSPEFFFRRGCPVLPCELAIPAWLGYNHATRVVLNNSGLLKSCMNVEHQIWKYWSKFFDIRNLGLLRAIKNLMAISVNRSVIFGSFGHLPLPHLKTSFAEIWKRKPEIMDTVSRHKFRNDNCVNHWMLCGLNMLNGCFCPVHEKRCGISVYLTESTVGMICQSITRQIWPEICINDTPDCKNIFALFEETAKAFDILLPEKSSFEKFPAQ